MAYTGTSIVDYLNSLGQASDKPSRAKLAKSKGIQGYTGTAQQNTQLLGLLRQGQATPSAPSTAPAPQQQPTTVNPQDRIAMNYPSAPQRQYSSNPTDQLNFDRGFLNQTIGSTNVLKKIPGVTGNTPDEIAASAVKAIGGDASRITYLQGFGFKGEALAEKVMEQALLSGYIDKNGNYTGGQNQGAYAPQGAYTETNPPPQGQAQGQQPQGQTGQTGQKPTGQQLNIQRNLTPGMQGDDVKSLQNFLIQQGYKISSATGYYGSETKAAVTQWQKDKGIQPSQQSDYGYFGPKSKAFLSGGQTDTGGGTIGSGTSATGATGETSTTSTTGQPDTKSNLINTMNQMYGTNYTPESLQSAFAYNPGQSYQQIVTDVMGQLGLPNLKTQIDNASNLYKQVQDELQNKITDINSNPWISEADRLKRVKAIQGTYDARISNAQSQVDLMQKQYDQGLKEAENAANQTLREYDREYSAKTDELKILMSDAEREMLMKERSQEQTTKTENKLLSVSEARELGLPFGTTKKQATKMGITPKATSRAKTKKASKPSFIDYFKKLTGDDLTSGYIPFSPSYIDQVKQQYNLIYSSSVSKIKSSTGGYSM